MGKVIQFPAHFQPITEAEKREATRLFKNFVREQGTTAALFIVFRPTGESVRMWGDPGRPVDLDVIAEQLQLED